MKKNTGFTLIELLIVIAIIGILAILVIVSVANARGRANETRVKSSLRQLRNMAELYYDTKSSSYVGLSTCMSTPNANNCLTADYAQKIQILNNEITAANNDSTPVESLSNVASFCLNTILEPLNGTEPSPPGKRTLCVDQTGTYREKVDGACSIVASKAQCS